MSFKPIRLLQCLFVALVISGVWFTWPVHRIYQLVGYHNDARTGVAQTEYIASNLFQSTLNYSMEQLRAADVLEHVDFLLHNVHLISCYESMGYTNLKVCWEQGSWYWLLGWLLGWMFVVMGGGIFLFLDV
jgi:hypothetical protein